MKRHLQRQQAFTLVELLVVIGIIAILIGILLPVMASVQKAGYKAKTQAIISNLATVIERYYSDFRAYPGPLSNDQVGPGTSAVTGVPNITMSENLQIGRAHV